MKRICKRIAAALCAGALLTGMTVPAVSAAEEQTLPSGFTLDSFEKAMVNAASTSYGDAGDFGSAAVGVFLGNEVLYTGYFGDTDKEKGIAADETSVYEWGSISKTLIWVSALQLWEQGRLDLNRDVREYLPEGFFQHLSYDEPITMLNLMNHNAGWQETTRPIMKSQESAILPLKEELQAIEPAQIHRPGEITAYSNYGAGVAGYVIECVTGQDYCDYVHEHIFDPLGMEHTALNPTHSDNAYVYEKRREMHCYRFSLGNCIDLGSDPVYVPVYPAGAATGTLGDLITYGQALTDPAAPLFDSQETAEFLFEGTDFYGESDIPMCAHGFWYTEYAVRVCGHNGATFFGQADLEFDRETGYGIAIMANEPDGNWYLRYPQQMLFGELSPETYASEYSYDTNLDGWYLPARSTFRGMLKFVPYLSATSGQALGKVQNLGKGVYQILEDSELDPIKQEAILFGEKVTPDNRLIALTTVSMDLLPESFYLVKLSLLTSYVLAAVIAVYLLLIRFKKMHHRRWVSYSGANAMTIGQTARICSVLLFLGTFMVYVMYNGLPYTAGAVIGIGQIVCAAVCIFAAVSAVCAIFSKKEKAKPIRYVLHTLANVLTVTAVVYFEMYWFWGC